MQCMAANTPELERSYAEVAGRAFKRPGEMRDHILKWMKRPRYSHAHTRIVVDNGAVVGGLAIVELPVRYGDTVLKLGGISCVATDPESQKRGYGRANMEDAVAYMAQNGYDLSFLLGIRDYYYRYGYRTAIVWFECRISPNVYSAKPAPGLRVRRARKSDIPGMAALYEKNGAQCDLSVVREKKDWLWYFDFGRFSDAHVVVNSEKNIVGYLVCRGAGRVDEIGLEDTTEVYETVLAFLQEKAKQAFSTQVTVYTPGENGFARYCLYKKRSTWARWTDYQGGPMLRLFNVENLFRKIAPTLQIRWQRVPRGLQPVAFTVQCPMGKVAFVPTDNDLMVTPGAVAGEVVVLPDEALTELVLGFRPAADVVADAGARPAAATVALLDAIFPVSTTFLSPSDHM